MIVKIFIIITTVNDKYNTNMVESQENKCQSLLLTEIQRKRFHRDGEIVKAFGDMRGAVRMKISILAIRFRLSESRIRQILKSQNLIGWKL